MISFTDHGKEVKKSIYRRPWKFLEANEVGGIVQGYTEEVDRLRWIDAIEVRYERGEIKKKEYDKIRDEFGK